MPTSAIQESHGKLAPMTRAIRHRGAEPPFGDDRSALEQAVARVGDRWSILVVEALLAGPQRFADLTEQVSGVAPNVLSRRLKDLEASGIVSSEPYSDRPRRLRYRLTPLGQDLAPALQALTEWGAQLGDLEGDDETGDDDSGGDTEVHYA